MILLLTAGLLHALPLAEPLARTLTSVDGKEVDMVIHEIVGDDLLVTAESTGGEVVKVPFARLSERDREEIKALRDSVKAGGQSYPATPFIELLRQDFWVDGGGDPAWVEPSPSVWAHCPYFLFFNTGEETFHMPGDIGKKLNALGGLPVLITYRDVNEIDTLLAVEKLPAGSAVLRREVALRTVAQMVLSKPPKPDAGLSAQEQVEQMWQWLKPFLPAYWPGIPRGYQLPVRFDGPYRADTTYLLRRDGTIATLRGRPLVGTLEEVVAALEKYYDEVH